MSTSRETIFAALQALLLAISAIVLRGGVQDDSFPTAGLLIMRDGEPWDA